MSRAEPFSTFSVRVRDELARVWPRGRDSAWAELAGLALAAGRLHVGAAGPYLELVHEQAAVARKSYRLLREHAQVPADVWARRRLRLRRGILYLVRVPPGPAVGMLCRRLGIAELRLPPRLIAAPGRRAAFLRGLFLGAGSLGDPEGGHHLELDCASGPAGDAASDALREAGIAPRRTERRGVALLYWKNGEEICEFLRLVGARQTLFAYEEARIWAQVRNDVNRLVNADTANVSKTVSAALGQVADIRALEAAGQLARLPWPLREVAAARLSHPELSLAELGRLLDPPLGKSGTHHRLRGLQRLAALLRDGPAATAGDTPRDRRAAGRPGASPAGGRHRSPRRPTA